MQIVLVVGSTDYVLAHGATRAVGNHVGPDDQDAHDCAATPQVDPLLRGTSQRIQDRGNLVSTLRFGVQVQLATVEAARKYKATYPVTLPRFGVLEERYDDSSKVRWAVAHVTQVNVTADGVTCRIRYNITATTPTIIAPP